MQHATWLFVLAPLGIQSPQSPDPAQSSLDRARERYAAVERELGTRDVSHLTAEQRAARAALIAVLGTYRIRGDFTINTDFPGARVPYFVDHEGRLCAVATLLHATGEDELVRDVAAANNHIWVSELRSDERFADWLERVGLAFDEAVRIQMPGAGGGGAPTDDGPGDGPPTGGPTAGRPPVETVPSAPATGGPAPAATPRGARPGASTGAAAPPGPPAGFTAGPMTMPDDAGGGLDDWMMWWELNKLRWIEPQLRARPLPSDDLTTGEQGSARLRRTLAPRIQAELGHAQADVRSAAAFAYARVAGAEAVPSLLALFADASREVRESAILALGATASDKGVHALLTLLRSDDVPTPLARPLAIVALGVAHRRGVGRGTDAILARLLDGLERDGGDDVLHAALLFQNLSSSPELAARVRCATGRFEEDCEHEEARAQTIGRALEALRFDAEPAAVLPRMLDAVHGRSLDQRRSAAGALAELPGALEPLLTAFELEEEPLTRGRLLLSIGENGGERARDFLVERLTRGRKNERAWAGLALGILAGADDDETARAALRKAQERAGVEKDALLLAAGLARDERSHELLVETLASNRSDRTRMFAAVALGLIGEPEGHVVLSTAIGEVTCPFARSGMALALAMYGDPGDLPLLMDLMRRERRPESLRDMALAIGLEGSPRTVGSLSALFEQDLPATVRAAVLDALGLALLDDPALALPGISRASNHTAWPDWVLGLFQHPL